MSYSLAEAAAAVGVNKTTVLRAVKSGKISGTRDEHGNWRLEPAEVHRVYEPVVRTDAETQATQPNALTDLLVAELRATIADKNTVIADLRSDRNEWREAHERAQVALTEAIAAAQRLLPAPDAPPVEQSAVPIEQGATTAEQALMAVEQALLMPIEQEAKVVEQETTPIEEEATAVDLPRLGAWQRALDMLAAMGSAPARLRS